MPDGDQINLMPLSQPSYSAVQQAAVSGAQQYAAALNDDNILGSGDWKNNPNYKLLLTDVANGISVTSYIPEQTVLRLQNQWETILAILGGFSNRMDSLKNSAQAVGVNLNYKALTTKVWRHSEPLTFDFKLEFDAETSTQGDVVTPVMNLIKMTSPKRNASFGGLLLEAPGPSLINPERRISLRIGKFLYIDSVIVNSLDISVPTAFDEQGLPIAMDADISLETYYTPDRDDIEAYFSLGNNRFVTVDNPIIYDVGGIQGINAAINATNGAGTVTSLFGG